RGAHDSTYVAGLLTLLATGRHHRSMTAVRIFSMVTMGWLRAPAFATLSALLVLTQPARGQDAKESITDIAQAVKFRDANPIVSIAGRATVGSGKLQTGAFDVAIQDGTGGIRVYSRTPQAAVQEGDSVVAAGTIKSYRGNLELVATKVTVVATGRRTVHPLDLAIDTAMIARHVGEFVRVHGHVAGAGRSEGGQWLRLL